ncbi:glucan endo-1,3-beta-D-glucosidase-like [Salvia splendens]|uniref:glucan endo-1,3-beta-D-glucosidase-like n=1 Tax=Salvia splendens TaxID=180675 RepID=UPI001C27D6FA|nr:glucan endo-1,3-beta-D-glucosidase-like [Salvia splendens]
MGKAFALFFVPLFLISATSHSQASFDVLHNNETSKTWCIAKPSSEESVLIANINYACSQVDCRILQKGCPCFIPNNLINHASIAMNLYYHSKGSNHWNCYFGNSGLLVVTNPSYGSCIYE